MDVNSYKDLVTKSDGISPLWRPERKLKHYIKMNIGNLLLDNCYGFRWLRIWSRGGLL
jgi:hypothetical protein